MRRLFSLLSAVLVCACLLLLSGCQENSPRDRAFRLPLSGEPRQLDPQVCADEASRTVVLSLFEGLTRLDSQGNPVAGVATGWKKEGNTYTFTLGESYWSDGVRVTAADFVYGFRRAVNPATRSPIADKTDVIAGAAAIRARKAAVSTLAVAATDTYTFSLTAASGVTESELLYALSLPPFMPCRQNFFLSTNARYGLETDYLLTNGAFTLESWTHNESLLLVRNDRYPYRDEIAPERVRLMISVAETAPAALQNGTLDISPITAAERGAVTEAGDSVVTLSDTVLYLWFHTTLPCLSNATIRAALRDSIEWDGVPALLDAAGYTLADGYTSPAAVLAGGAPYRTESNAIRFISGGGGAAERLAAGLQQAELSKMPTLTLLCEDTPAMTELAQYIVQCWQKHLGLYFRLEPLSADALDSRMRAGNYQLALWQTAATDETAKAALALFTNQTNPNVSGLNDTAFNTLLARTDGGSAAAVSAAEQTLTALCPAVPIAFVQSYYGVVRGVEDIRIHPFDGGRFGTRYDFTGALKYSD